MTKSWRIKLQIFSDVSSTTDAFLELTYAVCETLL